MPTLHKFLAPVLAAVALTGALTAAAPASADPNLDGDVLPPVISEAPPAVSSAPAVRSLLAPAPAAAAADAGYATGYAMNAHTYTVHLVASARVEQYRSVLVAVAGELDNAGLAYMNIAPGQVGSVPSNPAVGDIYFETDPSSPCGVANVAGCTQPWAAYRADAKSTISTGGVVYILPVTDGYSFTNKRHVVGHEIGHALGLDHYASAYAGQTQIMHPSSYANSTFQAGDRNGLATLNRNATPVGQLTAVTALPGGIHVTGWGYDPDQIGSATISLTVNGATAATFTANAAGPAAQAANHPYGMIGFDTQVGATAGAKSVCASVVNWPAGANTSLGCGAVTVTGPTIQVDRTYGADRYESAVQVAKATFPTTAPVVFIATGANFPDALSAAPAAAKLGGPLFLTDGKSLTASVVAEIQSLTPDRIVIVGGSDVVTSTVEARLRVLAPTVDRIDGVDRYATSRNGNAAAFTTAPTVYLATGAGFADALYGSAAAAAAGDPLILIPGGSSSVDPATTALLKQLGATHINVVGGPAVVTASYINSLNAIAPAVRIAGSDRYTTSAALAASMYQSADHAFIATGTNFPDGVYGAIMAGANKSPMMLSQPGCVPSAVMLELGREGVRQVTLIGGPGALTAAVAALKVCPN